MPDEYHIEHDGESFSLIDYILVLLKRWKTFSFIVVLFLVMGVFYWKTLPSPQFPYATSIEIGSQADGTLIEDSDTINSKLTEAYIPAVVKEQSVKNGYEETRYGVRVDISKKGGVLTFKTYSGKDDESNIVAIHQGIVNLLIKDQAQKGELIKKDLEKQKFRAELALESLKEDEKLFRGKRELVEINTALVKRQIDTVSETIHSLEKDRLTAFSSVSNQQEVSQSLATSLLLIDNSLLQYREQLQKLEQQLYIDIQNKNSELDKEEANVKRAQQEQAQTIKDFEFRLQNLQGTHLLSSPLRLFREPKKDLMQIIAIFGAVGIFLGLFMAALVELVVRARQSEVKKNNKIEKIVEP